jgi:hypothetical protein
VPVTLVTGTGTGFATALHFARHGHQVVATMRNLAKAGPLETTGREEKLPLVVCELDVARPESIDRAVAATVERDGPIDVLVNNAGTGGATPLELIPEDDHRGDVRDELLRPDPGQRRGVGGHGRRAERRGAVQRPLQGLLRDRPLSAGPSPCPLPRGERVSPERVPPILLLL